MTPFLLSAAASAIMLLTVPLLKRYFLWLEIFVYWIFSASILQLQFVIVSFNLKYIQLHTTILEFWTLKLSSLIIIPVCILWYLAAVSKKDSKASIKLGWTILFALLITIIDYLYSLCGVLDYVRWTLVHSFLLYVLLLAFSAAFMALYRSLMRKEGIRT